MRYFDCCCSGRNTSQKEKMSFAHWITRFKQQYHKSDCSSLKTTLFSQVNEHFVSENNNLPATSTQNYSFIHLYIHTIITLYFIRKLGFRNCSLPSIHFFKFPCEANYWQLWSTFNIYTSTWIKELYFAIVWVYNNYVAALLFW